MERREDNDLGSVAMPGFIDILSTVIIMFVFFVTVIAIMLYVHTIKFKAEVVEKSKVTASQEIVEYVKKIQSGEISSDDMQKILDLADKKKAMEQELDDISKDVKQVRATLKESESDQAVHPDISNRQLEIYFEKNAITLNKNVDFEIESFLEQINLKSPFTNSHFYIVSSVDPNAPTVGAGRQVALGRILNVRNSLIKMGIPSNKISISYEKEDFTKKNAVLVSVK